MAQAVFNEHPLEHYLRESGETQQPIPGVNQALVQELESISPFSVTNDDTTGFEWDWRSQLPPQALQVLPYLESLISTAQLTKSTNPLTERFKYNVISSSLLSPNLAPPSGGRQTPRSIPGRLPHSRSSSQDSQQPAVPTSYSPGEAQYGLLSGLVLVFAILLSMGLTSLAILILWAGLIWIFYLRIQSRTTKFDLTPCLDSLDDLISTNNNWEAVVQEAVNILENDDHGLNSSSHSLVSSSLRVALHSTLQTTQTQCDNVRHLLSALTSPSDLSQLSEMYAPPSPTKSTYSPHDSHSLPSSKPFHRRLRTTSIPSAVTLFTDTKRQTWNGPQPGFSYTSSSMIPVIRKRQRHRSDLSSLLSNTPSFSAPVSPTPSSPLARVSENPEADLDPIPLNSLSQGDGSFGAAALKLQRGRGSNGLDAISSSWSKSSPHTHNQSLSAQRDSPTISPRGSASPSSRFTTINTSRQPLSSSGLHHALQAAMGAKRYACAHLLALRFEEDEEDGTYWEDVRSVMELLVVALNDAGTRLQEAMGEVEVQKFWDQTPTPSGSPIGSPSPIVRKLSETNLGLGLGLEVEGKEKEKAKKRKRLSELVVSFAPMPSHLNKFAAHVGAIQSALEDARGYLERCVSALRGLEEGKLLRVGDLKVEGEEEGEHPALRAYERLRRELGFALRECERGRSRLLDLVQPSLLPGMEDEEDSESMPGLGHDSLSEESDKADVSLICSEEYSLDERKKDGVGVVGVESGGGGDSVDEVSRHLLMSADAGHLPAAHSEVEQVFEADSSMVGDAKREKSKLSREERIKLVKARRVSVMKGGGIGLESSPVIGGGHEEKWGPSGEVVQELKDMIWKVGERRRKVQSAQLGGEPEITPPVVRPMSSLPSLDTSGSRLMAVSPPRRVSSLLAMSPGSRSGGLTSPLPSMRSLFESLQRELPVVKDEGEGVL